MTPEEAEQLTAKVAELQARLTKLENRVRADFHAQCAVDGALNDDIRELAWRALGQIWL
jgi:hypothetical protein